MREHFERLVLPEGHQHDHWPVWISDNREDGWIYECWCGDRVKSNPSRVRGPSGCANHDEKVATMEFLKTQGVEGDDLYFASIREMEERFSMMSINKIKCLTQK